MSSKHSPDHYQLGRIEVWDFIVDQDMDYLLGNVIKYVCRAGAKPGESREDDLRKAIAYLNRALKDVRTPERSRDLQEADGSDDQSLRALYLGDATAFDL
jgi:hypothetical protein